MAMLQAALKAPQGLADLLTRLEGTEAAQDLYVQCAAAGARASCGDIIGAADALQQVTTMLQLPCSWHTCQQQLLHL